MITIDKEIHGQLFAIAYKMTGQVAVSKDICQEAIRKCLEVDANVIQNTKAYLIKATINTAISHLNKTKKERESYWGTWLPEPIIINSSNAWDYNLDLDFGLTVVLSNLNPKERAIFILKESFDFSYEELSKLLELTPENCRKIYQRLKEKIPNKNSQAIRIQEKERLLSAFITASQQGDLSSLIQVLKEDIALYSDGGGKISAAKNILHGVDTILKFLTGLYKKQLEQPNIHVDYKLQLVNGEPGFLLYENHQLATVGFFEMENNLVTKLFFVRNPDKIRLLETIF